MVAESEDEEIAFSLHAILGEPFRETLRVYLL
jgi:hypothetical protein